MALFQGINQGIRTGLAVVDSVQSRQRQDRLDAERSEDRTYQRGLQAAQAARLEKQDKRQGAMDGLAIAESMNKQAAGLASAGYLNGSLSPESESRLQSLTSQADSITKQSHADLGYGQKIEEANATFKEIDAGADIAAMPARKVADAFRYIGGHPTSNYLDNNGVSEIGKAYADFSAGMESGDMSLMVNGANTLLAPEIKYGVGTQNDKGDTIIDKRAAAVYPSARDPKKGVMDMTITARRKDGTTYEYPAWMTKGRGSAKPEGGDEHEFDIEPVLNRINAYGELLGVIHDPVKGPLLQKKFMESQQAGDDDVFKEARARYAQMAVARGADPKNFAPGKQTHETKNRGGYDEDITYDEFGKETGRKRVERTPVPKERDPLTEELTRARIKNLEQGDMSSPESIEANATLIAEGRVPPLSGYAMRSPAGQAIMARVLELNPEFQGADYATGLSASKAFGTGKQGQAVRSFNVALSHLDTLSNLSDALQNGDTPLINKLANQFSTQTGGTAPNTFNAAKKIVSDEIVKSIIGSGGGVSDREEAAKTISAANTPAQLKEVIRTYKELMTGQIDGLRREYEASTGRKDFDKYLGDQARATKGAAGPASNSVGAPATNSKGWTLHRDGKGNQAYVSPDGKSFEEVR